MDAKHAALKEKLEFHLQQAAAMATEIRLTEFAGRTRLFRLHPLDHIDEPFDLLLEAIDRFELHTVGRCLGHTRILEFGYLVIWLSGH